MDDTAPPTEAPLTGHRLIADYCRRLDSSPGVYRMLDAQGAVLYVGKARNLKARVSNYARPSGHSGRIARMIRETASMMFLTTRTETEALLLEQNLIKQLKPRYNVLLRDDKSFPNILVAKDHPFPQIKKHRGARSEKGDYYGPFASAGAVNRTLNQLQRVFLLRSCTDATFSSRTRPCLLHQIKRCSAPCVGRIDQDAYAELVADAERFLQGRSTAVQARLGAEMAEAAQAMEYERAAALRDRIKALTAVQSVQAINPKGVAEADVVALHMEAGQACVQVFFIRGNQSWGNRDFYPRTGGSESAEEIMQAFLAQFYDDKVPPRLILLSHGTEDADLMAATCPCRTGARTARRSARPDAYPSGWKWSWIVRAIAAEMPGAACRSSSPARATALALPKCASSARLRVAPTPAISSSGFAMACFVRRARWVPMAQRCASSRRRWMKYRTGSFIGRARGRWPGRWNSSLPWSRSSPLATPIRGMSSTPISAMIPATADTCPAPPSISSRSGQASDWRSGSSFSRWEKRRVRTSRIMPKSSPGVISVPLMLNLRYWLFIQPSGPATIMPPTGAAPWMWLLS